MRQFVAALLALLVLSACTDTRSCTALGCSLGTVDLRALAAAEPSMTAAVICNGGDCTPALQVDSGRGDIPGGTEKPPTAPITVTLLRDSETLRVLTLDDPKIDKHYPNGPGCGECYTIGTVTLDPTTGQLISG